MRLFLVVVVVLMSWLPTSAQTECTGVVTAPGGKPLIMAHVALLTPDAVSVLQVVQASSEGTYRLTLPRSGFWILRFTGVGYADHSVTLFTQDRKPVELNITLGCYTYYPGDLDLKVIGDFNLWNILTAVPMKKQREGVYSAEIPAKTDSVSFRLRGCRDRESAEGVRNVAYVLNKDGSYNARIRTTGGVAKITFDESLLDRSASSAKEDFVKATRQTKGIAAAVMQWWRGDEDYLGARILAARSHKVLDSTMFDWRPRLADLFQKEQRERDTVVRSVWALAYLSTSLNAHMKDVASSTTCMESLGPASPVWTMNPNALSLCVRNTSWPEARREAYIQAALATQPDRSVKEAVLFNEFTIALLSEQKTKAAGYYDILTTEFADTPTGRMIREKYSRPGTVPKGK